MIPAASALLSLLVLKLLDKERRSHIDDFNFDEALGLFAGLNVLPKKTFVTDYSYRTTVPVHGPNLLCNKLVMSEVCPLGLPSLNHSGTPSHRKPRLPSWPSWTPSTDESLSWSDVSAISRPG